jgi:hypothetical protein
MSHGIIKSTEIVSLAHISLRITKLDGGRYHHVEFNFISCRRIDRRKCTPVKPPTTTAELLKIYSVYQKIAQLSMINFH